MHSWLASARLRRETASAWWLVWSCSGGYPGVPRGGGELRVACAAPPTAVPASVGAGGVCNTREARTPCWARSRAGLSDLFVAYPPTARPRRLLRPPRTTPNPPAPPLAPKVRPTPPLGVPTPSWLPSALALRVQSGSISIKLTVRIFPSGRGGGRKGASGVNGYGMVFYLRGKWPPRPSGIGC